MNNVIAQPLSMCGVEIIWLQMLQHQILAEDKKDCGVLQVSSVSLKIRLVSSTEQYHISRKSPEDIVSIVQQLENQVIPVSTMQLDQFPPYDSPLINPKSLNATIMMPITICSLYYVQHKWFMVVDMSNGF